MSTDVSIPPRVFVSYSWDSPEHAEQIRNLADQLRQQGVECAIDQYEEAPPEGLTSWMVRHIRDDDYVLMICTPTYYRRVTGDESLGIGLGARFEGHLIRTNFYHDNSLNTKFLPVLLRPEHREFIPDPFRDSTYYDLSTSEGYEKLYRRITRQPAIRPPALGAIVNLPIREPGQWPTGNQGISITPVDDPLQPVTREDFAQLKQELEADLHSRFSNMLQYLESVYPPVHPSQSNPIQPRDPQTRATFIVPAAKARLQSLLLELSPLGGDAWELTNKHQPAAAITMSVIFHLLQSEMNEDAFTVDPDRGKVTFAIPPGRRRTVRQVLDLYAVLRALNTRSDFIVQNDETGSIAFSGRGKLDASLTPFEEALVDALQAIQDAYPLVDFFYPDELSKEEADHILHIGAIVRSGTDTRTLSEATMELKIEVLANLLSMLPADGIARGLGISQREETHILGAVLDLGEVNSSYCPLRINDSLDVLRARLGELEPESVMRVMLVPTDANNREVVHRYTKFLRRGED